MSDFAEPGSGAGEVCAGCGARIWQDGLSCGNCGSLRFDRSGALELAPRMRRLAAYLIDTLPLTIIFLVMVSIMTEVVEDGRQGSGVDLVTPEEFLIGPVVAEEEPLSSEITMTLTDQVLIGVVVLTTGVLVWLWSAGQGQSPGMRILGLFVYRSSGRAASAIRVIVRDLWPYGFNLLFALVALVAGDSIEDVTTTAALTMGLVYVISAACVLWLRDRRALHDLAFDTVVVQQRRMVLGTPIDGAGGPPRHGRPSPPGELPPDR